MNHQISEHNLIQHLRQQYQTAQTYYLQLSQEVSDQQLSRWFKLYSDQKENCIKKLERILEKIGQASQSSQDQVILHLLPS